MMKKSNFKNLLAFFYFYLHADLTKRNLNVILTKNTNLVKKSVKKMPKYYSEKEKEYIKKRLKEEAAALIGQYGIRHTTVDEIVRRACVPKGTFYLFYESKELLIFEVLLEQHDFVDSQIIESLAKLKGKKVTATELTKTIFDFFKLAFEIPVLKLINTEEVELLMRKLPEKVVAEHFGNDTDMVEKIFSIIPAKKSFNPKVISASFHAIYFACLHKKEIGEENFDEALKTLIYGVVSQIV